MNDSFVNSRGLTVKCKPVAAEYSKSIADNIRAQFIAQGEPVEPPKRWIPKMGGGVVAEELNVTNLETDEERELFGKHLEATGRLQFTILETLTNALALEGVELDHVPTLWIKKQKLIGNPLPIDEDELRLQYIKSELIVTFPMGPGEEAENSDFSQLSYITKVLSFTGLSEEAEARLRSSFRGSKDRPVNGNGDDPGGVEGDAGGALLELQSADVGGPDSEGLPEGAELV